MYAPRFWHPNRNLIEYKARIIAMAKLQNNNNYKRQQEKIETHEESFQFSFDALIKGLCVLFLNNFVNYFSCLMMISRGDILLSMVDDVSKRRKVVE